MKCKRHCKRWCFPCLLALNPFFVPEHMLWSYILRPFGVAL